MKETDVILNFVEDCRSSLVEEDMTIELPAGSWAGSKNRNIADIHGKTIPNIEAKERFSLAKKDFENPNKNLNIKHYIYASENLENSEIEYWKDNQVSVAIYLTPEDKWFIFESEKIFSKIIDQNKIYNENNSSGV